MPRIRTIKPDAFLSESLSSVPRGTRWTFAGLWTYADDRGRARDDVRLVKAALYPLDDDVSLVDVEEDIALLVKIGGVCRYVVDGRRLLHMPNWGHQKINRPTESKLAPCPEHEGGERGHVVSGESSVSDHGGLTEDSPWERKGTGKGKDSPSSADADGDGTTPEGFEEFWDVYDHKVGRKAAIQKYRRALRKPGVTPERLLAAAGSYVAGLRAKGKHPQFTAHAETWLNGERWEDEPDNVHHLPIPEGAVRLPPLPKPFFDQ